MKIIVRKTDILNESNRMEDLLVLKGFPVHMGVSMEPCSNDLQHDMIFSISQETGMIQIKELIDGDTLYQSAHYNNIAKNWEEHHNAFADFMSRYTPKNIFEPGGGTGILAKYYMQNNPDSNWTILDAVPNPDSECKALYIKGFFDENYKIEGKYDAIVHSHCMEHFYNPIETVQNMADNMPDGSYMFFSIPNLEAMFEHCYTNVLNFEHSYYCAEPYTTYILNRAGYEVIEKQKFKEEHSIFYAARLNHKNRNFVSVEKPVLFEGCYEKNKMLFKKWIDYHEKLILDLNKQIEGVNSKIYLFGAHVFAQYLLGFGLNADRIEAVLDNDSSKQGKRLNGTKYKVYSPSILKEEKNPVVVLCAGTHNQEIKEDIWNNINKETKFIP